MNAEWRRVSHLIKASERPSERTKINSIESESPKNFKSQPNWHQRCKPRRITKLKSCAINIRGEPKSKSCAISIRGEPRSSPVRSASEANQDQVLCDQHPRQTKINQDQVLCNQHPRRTKLKSCAISIRGETSWSPVQISIRGEPRSNPVQLASEANPDQVLCN